MSIKLGFDGVIYRGTAGAKATTVMKNVTNVSLNLETGSADITTRATNGWRAKTATLREGSVEFEMLFDPEDTDYQTIAGAYFSKPPTPLAFFVTDGSTASPTGLDADFSVTNFSISQELEEAQKVNVTIEPTLIGGTASRAPIWWNAGTASTAGNNGVN